MVRRSLSVASLSAFSKAETNSGRQSGYTPPVGAMRAVEHGVAADTLRIGNRKGKKNGVSVRNDRRREGLVIARRRGNPRNLDVPVGKRRGPEKSPCGRKIDYVGRKPKTAAYILRGADLLLVFLSVDKGKRKDFVPFPNRLVAESGTVHASRDHDNRFSRHSLNIKVEKNKYNPRDRSGSEQRTEKTVN